MAGGYSWKRALAILAVLIVALVLVSLAAGGSPSTAEHVIAGPIGTIFISGNDDAKSPFLKTFALDVVDGSQTRLGEDDVSLGNFYAFTPNGDVTVFAGITKERIEQALVHAATPGNVTQIYRAPITASHRLPSPTAGVQLTTEGDVSKTMPAVSDDGVLVAYVAAASSMPSATSSIIHLTSGPGSDHALFAGIDPQWISSTAFYYIAADGIRLYDAGTQRSSLVLPIEGQGNFKIAVSPDRAMLAFSEPNAGSVYLYRIMSEGLLLKPLTTLDLMGFWVVFSPDNRYAAIQTAARDGNGVLADPHLVIIDTASFATVKTIPLSSLLNDRLFVTSWQP